jgi:hypothetical protein
MKERCTITLNAHGCIQDLARVIDVLARLDLTPRKLSVKHRADGWRALMKVDAARPVIVLCVERLRNQFALTGVVARDAQGAEIASC